MTLNVNVLTRCWMLDNGAESANEIKFKEIFMIIFMKLDLVGLVNLKMCFVTYMDTHGYQTIQLLFYVPIPLAFRWMVESELDIHTLMLISTSSQLISWILNSTNHLNNNGNDSCYNLVSKFKNSPFVLVWTVFNSPNWAISLVKTVHALHDVAITDLVLELVVSGVRVLNFVLILIFRVGLNSKSEFT